MTAEQYAIIVDHALRLMGDLPPEELRKIEPWLTRRHIRHARAHGDPHRKQMDELSTALQGAAERFRAKYPETSEATP